MSISVYDAMQLKQLKPLKLIAGQKGLQNQIERIGILDFEIIEGIEGNFYPGDFVLTTFTAVRDNIQDVERCIDALIKCKISGLAIKTIYYDKLPLSTIELANKKGLPIFMFGDDVYFEFIIEDLMEGMHARSHMELLATKIEILFQKDLKKSIILELANEINPSFFEEHIVFYLKEKSYTTDENTLKFAERYQRSRLKSIHHSMVKYQEGMILILTFQKMTQKEVTLELNYILKQLNLIEEDFVIGKSQIRQSLSGLDMSIKESIYATEAGEILGRSKQNYDEIGIYKILLPYSNDLWLKNFVKSTLDPIKEYDHGKLIETAQQYVTFGGDMKKTAEALFQHQNTIRYRINKMQELMSEKNEGHFYEQLSLAIKSEKVLRRRL